MRALFVTSPGLSHILPTVPLAHALRAAGHQVLYATGGDIHGATEAGLCVVDVTPGLDYAKVFIPEDSEVSDPMHGEDVGVDFLAQMFARVSTVAVEGARKVAASWRPDLVVHTPTQGAGPLIAAELGIPAVELPLGPADGEHGLAQLIRQAMSGEYERLGITGKPRTSVRLMPMPPSIEALLPGDRSIGDWPVRYVPYNGGGVLPDWLPRTHGDRRRIAVTLGAIDARWGGIARLAPLFSRIGAMDAEFVLTLGGGDVSLLGELPGNVRAVEWIPLGVLLETCDGLIHHGGTGTMMTALVSGVPQCVIPQGSYQNIASDVVVARGIGFRAEGSELGADDCVRLLEDESLHKTAEEVRNEAGAMPPVADLVARLAALTA
ncbi:nucleotide disphospho-sugar-binding domain-containing protein [Streptomyces sp. NPDC003710]